MSWKSVDLASVAAVFNGKTPSKAEQRDSGHPVLKIKDVDESGVFKGGFGSFVDPEFADKFSSKKINVDDTLVLNAAHNSDYVGSKQYRAESSVVDSLPTGEWLVARADAEQLHPRFLNYWFRSPQVRFQIKYLVKGIHLYPRDVARLKILLPSLAEQKRIATILDKADAIRRKRQQAIQLADEFLRAVFLDMFGDIPAKRSPFELKGCRGAVSAASGKSSKAVLSDQTTEIPIYGGNGINGYATKALYDEPVIVVGRVGQQCAITHLTSGPSWVTDNAIVVKVVDKQQFNPVYLAHAFQNSPIRDVVTRLDLPFVNQAMILDHPIPHPPIELQNKYADIHKTVLRTVDGLNKSANYSSKSFNSLAQKAFTGQL